MSQANSNKNETKSALLWAAFILGLIAINFAVAGFALVIAIGDPSFRPLPDYSAQAVDWQIRKDLIEESRQLGWEVQLDQTPDTQGVRVRVSDSQGRPVRGASGKLMAFHLTRAGEPRSVPLEESQQEPGAYMAQFSVDRDGKWQVALELEGTEGQRFLAERTVDWSHR